MSSHKNTPVVIGISSLSQKDKLENLDEALILMDSAVKAAIKDTENNNITKYIDDIRIPKGYWKYRDPGRWIADKNNISNVKTSIASRVPEKHPWLGVEGTQETFTSGKGNTA